MRTWIPLPRAGLALPALLALCMLFLRRVACHSANEGHRQYLMSLDPRNPSQLQRPRDAPIAQLQRQHHLQQQVQHYASRGALLRGVRDQGRRHRATNAHIHASRSLQGSTAAASRHASIEHVFMAPTSCFHSTQQEVQLAIDFDCHLPIVLRLEPADFAEKACTAALNQLKQYNPNPDYDFFTDVQAQCAVTTRCSSPSSGEQQELQLSIFLPFTTCAVFLETLAETLALHPGLLFQTDLDLTAAVVAVRRLSQPDRELQAIQAAIQHSSNEVKHTVNITDDELYDSRPYESQDDSLESALEEGWLWDASIIPDWDSGYSIWLAAVSIFGTGLGLVGLLLMHQWCLRLTRRRAEQRLVVEARAAALAAAGQRTSSSTSGSSNSHSSSADLGTRLMSP